MTTQPEALRLADVSRLSRHHEWHLQVDAELRRLHAERAAADGVINDLVAKVRELQEANEAFGKRQEWWNEKMLTLEAQRDALLEAYRKMKNVAVGYSNLCDGSAFTRKLEREFEAVDAIARAAIKAVEETK